MKPYHQVILPLLIMMTMICMSPLAARSLSDAGDRMSPTAFIEARGAYMTYKSKLVSNNDTSVGIAYTLGFHAGVNRNIGILFRTDTSTTKFTLNSSQIQTTWEDSIIRYRWAWFYMGAIIGRAQLSATMPSDSSASSYEAQGQGYGGNVGLTLGLLNKGSFYLDVSSVTISKTTEKDQQSLTMGSRMDIDIGVAFHITKEAWDILVGISNRSYSLTTTTAHTESIMATYLGFRLNSFF